MPEQRGRVMNIRALKTPVKIVIAACFAVFVVLPGFMVGAELIQSWRVIRFSWRGQEYYAQFASACDDLLAKSEPGWRELRGGDLKTLPPMLRDLNPDRVFVDTNLVFIVVRRNSIIWAPEQVNRSWWNLTTSNEGPKSRRVLFSKMKPVSGGQDAIFHFSAVEHDLIPNAGNPDQSTNQ